MKRIIKYLIIIVVFIGMLYGLFLLSLMGGNPIKRYKTRKSANQYIEVNYKDRDYFIDKVYYNFKDENYYALVKSKSSKDTYFDLVYNNQVKFIENTYIRAVLNKENTANRIDKEYKNKVDVFLKKHFKNNLNFGYGNIAFSDMYNNDKFLNPKDLILDKEYDVNEFGKQAGYITVYLYDNNVSCQRGKELLIELKKELDKEAISFYSIDFNLSLSKEKHETENDLLIEHVLYSDFSNKFDEVLKEKCSTSTSVFDSAIEAKILSKDKDSLLVEVTKDTEGFKLGDQLTVHISDIDSLLKEKLKIDIGIKINFNGRVLESYPSQIFATKIDLK